jgi:hypothetical protein
LIVTPQVLGLVLLMAGPLFAAVLLLRSLDVFQHSGDFHPILGSASMWLPLICIVSSAFFWYRAAEQSRLESGTRGGVFATLFGGSLVWWAGGLTFAVYRGLGNLAPVPSQHNDLGEIVAFSIPCCLVSAMCASSAARRLDPDARFWRAQLAVVVTIVALVLGQGSLRRAFAAYDRSVAIDTIRSGGYSQHFFFVMGPGKERAVPELRRLADQPNLAAEATGALAFVSAGRPVLREMALDASLPPHTRSLAVKAVSVFRNSETDFANLDRDPLALAEDEGWISRLLGDEEVEVRNEALELTSWEAFIAPGRPTLIDRLRLAARDPHPATAVEATLLLAKLGDAPSYATVLGWINSGAADASVCALVLRDTFEFPIADTRYDDLLAAMSRDRRCAGQADEISRRITRRNSRRSQP